MPHNVALFDFANHSPDWLDRIAECAKEEPWGKKKKVLEIYLRANFEIAKQQQKIFEDPNKEFAIWRAGYLVTPVMEPIWLYYEKNNPRYKQRWNFKTILFGDTPLINGSANESITTSKLTVTYDHPEFHPQWNIYIDPKNFDHILTDHPDRLNSVFGDEADNPHRLFRTIYGEIMLEKKESVGVMPQWYMGGYNFLMPLYLTSPEKVDLTAALTIDDTNKRYQLRTLLLPHYAYANARSIVKSRQQFTSWAMLSDDAINESTYDDASDEN